MQKLSYVALNLLCLCVGTRVARADSIGLIGARDNLCLDVKDGSSANGAEVQLWTCSGGSSNQTWTLSGEQIRAGNGKCLDLTNGGGDGTKMQLYNCTGGPNQQWAFNGQAIQNAAHGLCLDVTDGAYRNGTLLQAYSCDWRSTGNQIFSFASAQMASRSSGGSSSGGATTFYGYSAISIDDFMAKNSECAWIKDAVVAAANDQGLNATFLATACIVESSCLQQISNSYGPFQFSDDGAWNEYGGAGKNRQNIWDAAYGAARYFKALIAQENGNLDNALRSYNGPLSQGGNPSYQKEYKTWMSGGSCWG